jgi:protein-L-isoaspartate(D-aspartate) O-methyltransferase
LTVGAEAQDRAQFMLLMRARGVRDLELLRALERAPRALFMPQRYGDIAGRDIALPIGCGQTAPPPSLVATMIELLTLEPRHRVLEIGAGTGYATALIAQLAREVFSLERCQSLALEAATRIEAFGVSNARVAWADALSPGAANGRFDRIIVHALIEQPFNRFAELLSEDGLLIGAHMPERESGREQRIVKLTRRGDDFDVIDAGAARSLAPLVQGLTRGL